MFLHQVVLAKGIPFHIALPKAPASVDASQLSEAEIHDKLMKRCDLYNDGRVQNASDAFIEFVEKNFK